MTHLIAGLFDIVVGCAMLLFFSRFMFQFAELDAKKDPAAKLIYQLTRVVDVFGRIFPTIGNGRINTAAIALMLLIRLIFMWGVMSLMRENSSNIGLFYMTEINSYAIQTLFHQLTPLRMFFVASMTLILDFLRLAQFLIVISFLVGFIAIVAEKLPPILGLANRLSEPLIEPFRKILPPMDMFDIAPMIAYFVIMLLEAVVQAMTLYLLTL